MDHNHDQPYHGTASLSCWEISKFCPYLYTKRGDIIGSIWQPGALHGFICLEGRRIWIQLFCLDDLSAGCRPGTRNKPVSEIVLLPIKGKNCQMLKYLNLDFISEIKTSKHFNFLGTVLWSQGEALQKKGTACFIYFFCSAVTLQLGPFFKVRF